MKTLQIAIDGPSGAGKSTIAKQVARELSFVYLDTGALYRAIGLYFLRQGSSPSSDAQVEGKLDAIEIALSYDEQGEQHIHLCGEDVSDAIRTNEASMAASRVSAIPMVRAHLLAMQREIAARQNVIMDGRDIGTVVLPHADVKIFLTATPEERTARRLYQLKEKGIQADYDQLLQEIKQRDFNDSNRAVAPLKPADDAVVLDTTGSTFEQAVQLILTVIREKLDHVL